LFESDKILFEIYRDKKFNEKFHVIYYTELTESTKYTAINQAMAGNSYFDGFIKSFKKDDAKQVIDDIIKQLNDGNMLSKDEIRARLKDYIP